MPSFFFWEKELKIIYAKKSSGIEGPGSFQNPEYYLGPDREAKSVVIHGDYPHIKADYERLGIDVEVHELPKPEPLTVSVKVGVTPELQAAIDEAKAECEKVQAENIELKEQLATAHGELITFKNDVTAMQARIDELVPKAKKPTAAELKAAKAADDAKAAEQPEE